MSDQNDEFVLAHDEYMSANNINIDTIPDDLDAVNEKINSMIDAYEENPTDALFDQIEAESKALKVKIQAWHEASKKPAPAPTPTPAPAAQSNNEPAPVAQPTPATPPTPAQAADDDDDEMNPWSYTSYLK